MQFAVYLAVCLALVAVILCLLILQKIGRPTSILEELSTRIAVLEQIAGSLPAAFREEAKTGRDDLRAAFGSQTEALDGRFASINACIGEGAKAQVDQLTAMRSEATEGRTELRTAFGSQTEALEKRFAAVETRLGEFGKVQTDQLVEMRKEASDGRTKLENAVRLNAEGFAASQAERLKETSEGVRSLSDRLLASQRESRDEQRLALEAVQGKILLLTESNDKRQEALRETVASSLDTLRTDNADKLEKMRATVEEKLQGTLEKRLGESFQLVSERLEQVHKGLGEMQNLATGVGDLKRVLSNVKSRGGWGEVQLGMLLEDMLTRDQFATNVRIRPDSTEIVEYAVRLPGRGGDDVSLWLPIDAKFPHEDYERLLQAQDGGLADEVEKAALALERAIRLQAKTISERYVHPPHSTDFAIMYLPTEGLFAEAIRRPGLTSEMQTKHRVMIQGPTTLAALLSSLQMGFRTLAIEKRSSEVWQVLGAAKAEFAKYGQVWEKLGKQLDTARKTVDEAGKRTRAVSRKLQDVETLEGPETPALMDLVLGEDEEADAATAE
jgi:DNA recombination protein RmuC